MISGQEFESFYQSVKVPRTDDRYFPLERLEDCLAEFPGDVTVSTLGMSVEGRPIYLLKIGSGSRSILGWSQMHGNETTTTKAMMDLFHALLEDGNKMCDTKSFLKEFTLYLVPMLNPDGAQRYSRYNANGVDLNRDAIYRSQPESRILSALYREVEPELCLNLHGQRSIYGFDSGRPALISFLAPSADYERSLSPARKSAMVLISGMARDLEPLAPDCIGRYDDGHNPHCVGDRFQSMGTPTILFEAGHAGKDYLRDLGRKMVFRAGISLIQQLLNPTITKEQGVDSYFLLPENRKNHVDIVFANAKFRGKLVDLMVQFEESLTSDGLVFVPRVHGIANSGRAFGHETIEMEGEEILINSHENVFVNEKLSTITCKKGEKVIFHSRN